MAASGVWRIGGHEGPRLKPRRFESKVPPGPAARPQVGGLAPALAIRGQMVKPSSRSMETISPKLTGPLRTDRIMTSPKTLGERISGTFLVGRLFCAEANGFDLG